MLTARVLAGKISGGARLTPREGLFLLSEGCDLLELGRWAMEARQKRHPRENVTYVVDTNPNYTNICDAHCTFCAFSRSPGDSDAYALTKEQVIERIRRSVEGGATTVLLQGGHNKSLPLEYYLDLVRSVKREFPGVTPHFYSASEIETMAGVSGKTTRQVLEALWQAGQRTLPGGGAEVLSERVRRRFSAKKGGPEAWIRVHCEAHGVGFKSTATMMYGHIETPEDIVEHWERVRSLQDETAGFTAFVPWSFKPGRSALSREVPEKADAARYLRVIAASRLYLDNVPHIQASWFSEGKKTGQTALHFGADDFGGTLIDENVHAAADFINQATTEEVKELIRGAGFEPRQRTTLYEEVTSA